MLQSRRRMLAMLAFAGVLAAILAMGFVSYSELARLTRYGARVQRSYELLQTLNDLTGSLSDTEANQRGYLLTQDVSYLTQYDDAVAQVRLALTELRRLAADELATQNAVNHLGQLAGAKLDELQDSIHATQTGRHRVAVANLADGRGRALMAAFQRDSTELETVQRRLLDERRDQVRRARVSSELVLASSIVLSLLLVIAGATISRRFDERRRMLEEEIAERRRAQEYRESLLISERAARSEAERATRLKDEFVATLSHELRTPLNAIVGWAHILGRDRRPDTITQGVEVIERNAKLQAQMIEDLLDMSRILSGKLLFELRPTELSGLLRMSVAAAQPAAEAKGVRLAIRLEPCGQVAADPARLQQIVWNLLSNAIKFTPRGGTVEVLLREADGLAEIAVADGGAGIRAEFLPFVFDRFRQADASTTRRHGGLGLGLSIVRSLVEMHSGTVQAQSPGEDQGSTFTVRLPLMRAHSPAVEQAAREASGELGESTLLGLRILVVDDEADARMLARRVLEESGAEVLLASSAAEAVAVIESADPPDLLLSDIGMPDEDGYSLIRRVRSLPGAVGRTRAIAVTALARDEDRKHALEAGYHSHISKPVSPAQLIAAVADLCVIERAAPTAMPHEQPAAAIARTKSQRHLT